MFAALLWEAGCLRMKSSRIDLPELFSICSIWWYKYYHFSRQQKAGDYTQTPLSTY
jgi:hypothetical protein